MTPGRLAGLLTVAADGDDAFVGPASGPAGKRAYGGHLAAQALSSACAGVADDRAPTALHVQFLRGGDAGEPVRFEVERTHDGRSSSSRRVLGRQDDRLLVTATALFAVPAAGPQHSDHSGTGQPQAGNPGAGEPDNLPRTGPIGPAPSLPLDEIDIRIDDRGDGADFVRRLWWRVMSPLPDDPRLHAAAAVYVTDIYGVDPVLAVHGHSMTDRSHHAATTDSSIWLHRRVFADRWNLLESRSPAAEAGRGVVVAGLFGPGGARVATLVHEGQAVTRADAATR